MNARKSREIRKRARLAFVDKLTRGEKRRDGKQLTAKYVNRILKKADRPPTQGVQPIKMRKRKSKRHWWTRQDGWAGRGRISKAQIFAATAEALGNTTT